VAIVGAGAIGGWLADALSRSGWQVAMVARGGNLEAIRRDGLTVEHPDGQGGWRPRCSRPAAGSADELGVQHYVLLCVKAQSLSALAPQLRPLLDAGTVIVTCTNGIPWWFLQGFAGPLGDQTLQAVDPDGVQTRAFSGSHTLGAVIHASAHALAPGRIRIAAADRFLVGEIEGAPGVQSANLAAALRLGGIDAVVSPRIREEIWAKLWGNMSMNPLSALTRSGTRALLDDAQIRSLVLDMMEEMHCCGERLGLNLAMTAHERIAVTQRLGDFRTSMLGDAMAGRRLEIEPQLGAVVEIADRLGIPTPVCRCVLALTRRLDATLGASAVVS